MRAQAAARSSRDVADGIGAVSRANRRENAASAATADIRLETAVIWAGSRGLLGFQCPLLLGTVDLTQVVDASVGLRGGAGLHEVRNRNRRQQTDDGYNDHDFYQGETRFHRCSNLHVFFTFPLLAA